MSPATVTTCPDCASVDLRELACCPYGTRSRCPSCGWEASPC